MARWERRATGIALGYGIAVGIIALDQATKAWITSALGDGQPPIVIIPDVLYLIYRLNTGMAFSLLLDASVLLALIAFIAAVAMAVIKIRLRDRRLLARVALGLLMGGAVGNLIDRLTIGAVVDFVYFAPINFPAFNVADSSLTIGVILAAWLMAWSPPVETRERAPSP